MGHFNIILVTLSLVVEILRYSSKFTLLHTLKQEMTTKIWICESGVEVLGNSPVEDKILRRKMCNDEKKQIVGKIGKQHCPTTEIEDILLG